MGKLLLYALIPALFAPSAFAFIEFRGAAGLAFVDPTAMNRFNSSQDVKQIYLLAPLSLSAFVRPFGDAVGLGVQWDKQSIKVNSSNDSTFGNGKLTTSRFAVKAYYHVYARTFITGPTLAIGLWNDFNYDGRNSVGTPFAYDKAKATSFAAAWEVGARFPRFMFGGDLGLQRYRFYDVSGSSGDAGFDVNLSGLILNFFMGLNF